MASGNKQSGGGKRKAAQETTRRSLRRKGTGEDSNEEAAVAGGVGEDVINDVTGVDGRGDGGVYEEVAPAPTGEGQRGGGDDGAVTDEACTPAPIGEIDTRDRVATETSSITDPNEWQERVDAESQRADEERERADALQRQLDEMKERISKQQDQIDQQKLTKKREGRKTGRNFKGRDACRKSMADDESKIEQGWKIEEAVKKALFPHHKFLEGSWFVYKSTPGLCQNLLKKIDVPEGTDEKDFYEGWVCAYVNTNMCESRSRLGDAIKREYDREYTCVSGWLSCLNSASCIVHLHSIRTAQGTRHDM